MSWARGMSNTWILNQLRITHFGRYLITIVFVLQLLALVHEGCLWIQGCIPIDAAMIHQITGMPNKGPHPMAIFGKSNELNIDAKVKKDYHVR